MWRRSARDATLVNAAFLGGRPRGVAAGCPEHVVEGRAAIGVATEKSVHPLKKTRSAVLTSDSRNVCRSGRVRRGVYWLYFGKMCYNISYSGVSKTSREVKGDSTNPQAC